MSAVDCPYRRLAVAVLCQACRDAARGKKPALAFLRDGPLLRFWCDVAGLDATSLGTYWADPERVDKRVWRAGGRLPRAFRAEAG